MEKHFDLKKTRNNLVAKDNRLIQNSRYTLSGNENKAILYLISKIQPNDKPGKRYIFNCREFQALIKWNGDASYKNIKEILTKLADMRWWIRLDDDTEALVRWFNIIHINKGTGDIEISFHEDMQPFLLQLQKDIDGKNYYTTYKLQNVTLMKHRYSPRIYEILKSYQYNNQKWTFENGTGSKFDLQIMIGDTVIDESKQCNKSVVPKNWANWAVFKRDVLDPAVKEINKYTDIKVNYVGKKEDIHKKKTRAIRSIEFYMVGKTSPEQRDTDKVIDAEYAEIEEKYNVNQSSIEDQFFKQHEKALAAEKEERKAFAELENQKKIDESVCPILYDELNNKGNEKFDENQIEALFQAAIQNRVVGVVSHDKWELFASDLIMYYYNKIVATPSETHTSTYNRLLDYVIKDYDNMVRVLLEEYKKR